MFSNRFSYFHTLMIVLLWGGFSVLASAAEGGLRLAQTRVVFDAANPNTKLAIKNSSPQVYLIKADVINTPEGNAQRPAPPFMVTPPMFRLEKESQNTLLIVRNGTAELPVDRESVFYLSLLAIPATTKINAPEGEMTSAQVSVGIRNVIKLFYRPKGLPMSAEAASGQLTFHHQGQHITVSNPTPYYVTLAQLSVNQHPIDVRELGPMIAPFSTQIYPVKGSATHAEWRVITDYGDMSTAHQRNIQSGVISDDKP
ncbi:molecular chaperone (plasmid) [Moellerella wisconsensis]|uniref:fimbrial biogenesis chaperone n=1 Tax=Moellerella wisconsensis TaxID=158849 RepID=UPI001F4E0005|nr:molecular chaperone [Moellerella wisconsensis]UNH29215.1 molecular chaperone [Moellerella wisconsensis]